MSNVGLNMYRKLACAAVLALALAPLEAQATTLAFNFDTTDGVFTVSGDLTIANSLDSAGGYDVTGMSGTVSGPDGGSIALVANPAQPATSLDSMGAWLYDNVVYPSGPWVDNSGLLFAAGGFRYNLYTSGLTYYLSSYNPAGGYNPGEVGRLKVSPIPEPATWLMMGLGFAALGAGRRAASRGNRAAAFA